MFLFTLLCILDRYIIIKSNGPWMEQCVYSTAAAAGAPADSNTHTYVLVRIEEDLAFPNLARRPTCIASGRRRRLDQSDLNHTGCRQVLL